MKIKEHKMLPAQEFADSIRNTQLYLKLTCYLIDYILIQINILVSNNTQMMLQLQMLVIKTVQYISSWVRLEGCDSFPLFTRDEVR